MRKQPFARPGPRLLALASVLACLAAPVPLCAQDDVGGVVMPNVVGSLEAGALATLRRLGIPVAETRRVSSERPAGVVLRQLPARGTPIDRRTRAVLWVSSGLVRVPDVRGGSVRDAVRELQGARLALGRVDSTESPRPAGTVTAQNPRPGSQARPGSRVSVTVSRQVVAVPDVRGGSVRDAVRELQGARLALGRVDSTESPRPAGTVVAQNPGEGTPVRPGTRVSVTLARRRLVTVPDLDGRSLAEAEARLRAQGLARGAVGARESDAPEGTVVAQSPAARTRVPPGTRVSLTLARQLLVTVPDLGGRTLAEVEAALRAEGLARGAVGARESDAPEGTVVAQSPAAGDRVAPGAAVAVTLAGVRPVVVPDVVGAARDEAARTLAAAGLVPEGGDSVADDAPASTVIAQSPAAGDSVRPGSGVRLVVSLGPAPAAVPPVVGLTRAEAERRLRAAGFPARAGSEGDSTWIVASQLPAAGGEAPPGTLVLLTLGPPPGPPFPWPLGAALLVLGGAATLWRRLRPKPAQATDGSGGGSPAPVVTGTAEWDPGFAKVSVAGKLVAGPEVKLRAHADPGAQSVEIDESLIAAEVEE